jgi:hypothetical protein
MSVSLDGNVVRLYGDCPVEDAETVMRLLQAAVDPDVSLADVRILHTAVLQVLLALRPKLVGPVRDPFISRWLAPLLM